MEAKNYNRVCVWLLLLSMVAAFVGPVLAEDIKPEIQQALDAGDTAKAISDLQKQIGLDKNYHYNYYVLGMIYYNQERYEQALEQFEEALDRKGGHVPSWYQLGMTNLKLDKVDEAEKAFKQGRKKAGKDEAEIFDNGLGLVAMAQEKYLEATKLFQQATLGDSANAEYWINLGDAYFYQGVPPLAVTYYEKALKLDTGSTEVYYHWAEACLELRDYTCAMDKLRTVLQQDSTHAPAWRRAGEIYFKAALSSRSRSDRVERFKETVGSYRQYFELADVQPDSAHVRPYFEIGMAYLNLNAFDSATTYFDKVLSIPYEPKDVYYYYGRALWGAQDYVKGAEILQKHLDWVDEQGEDYTSTGNETELYQMLGDCWFYRKHAGDAEKASDYTKAIQYWKRSLAQDSTQSRLLYYTAVGYHTLGSYDQAIAYYEKRIGQGVDSAEAGVYKNAAFCALNLAEQAGGDGGGPEEFVEPGMEPDEPVDPMVMYEQGAQYLVDYLQYQPADTGIMKRVADVYLYELGDCENAEKYYQRVLELDPKSCESLKSLGYAYFGGTCNRDYSKAINYLTRAHQCFNGQQACTDVTTMLYIAQAYHLRAAAKLEGKQDASPDFEQANKWYGQVLKCEPGNAEAKKGQDETQFEF